MTPDAVHRRVDDALKQFLLMMMKIDADHRFSKNCSKSYQSKSLRALHRHDNPIREGMVLQSERDDDIQYTSYQNAYVQQSRIQLHSRLFCDIFTC